MKIMKNMAKGLFFGVFAASVCVVLYFILGYGLLGISHVISFEPIFNSILKLIQVSITGGVGYFAYLAVSNHNHKPNYIFLGKLVIVCIVMASISIFSLGKSCVDRDPRGGCYEYEYSDTPITEYEKVERFSFVFLLLFIPALCAFADRRKYEI